MHATAKQPSETNAANTQTAEEALAHIKAVYRVKRLESELTMITAQTKAMEALIYCMTPLQSTGDAKIDAFYAKERNRQRLAATQTLLHIRTVQREKRLRQTMRAKAKAKAERLEPNRASDGSQASGHPMATTRAAHSPAPSRGECFSSENGSYVPTRFCTLRFSFPACHRAQSPRSLNRHNTESPIVSSGAYPNRSSIAPAVRSIRRIS